MGVYADCIFPHLMDWSMRGKHRRREREAALAPAFGDVLELGFGTGLNLPHYPGAVRTLTALEPADMLPRRVARRIGAARMPVERVRRAAESLPFPPGRFDCVVSTWTLCTIADPVSALREIIRVLRPGGRFLFIEHGRSDDPAVARWQDRLNPVWKPIGCGCNMNRKIDDLIRRAGLEIRRLDRFLFPGDPRVLGETYRGVAQSPAAAHGEKA